MITRMKINVGDKVSFKDDLGEEKSGEILSVLSDMDSYEDMRLKDGIPYYASKKMTAKENKEERSIQCIFIIFHIELTVDHI